MGPEGVEGSIAQERQVVSDEGCRPTKREEDGICEKIMEIFENLMGEGNRRASQAYFGVTINMTVVGATFLIFGLIPHVALSLLIGGGVLFAVGTCIAVGRHYVQLSSNTTY